MSANFRIRVDREAFSGGEAIRGTVVVTDGSKSRSTQVILEFVEDTDDYTAVAAAIPSGPLHEGDLEPGMAFPFEVTLPAHAYPNHATDNARLYWRLHVRSDEFGRDSHERRQITVLPGRARRTTG